MRIQEEYNCRILTHNFCSDAKFEKKKNKLTCPALYRNNIRGNYIRYMGNYMRVNMFVTLAFLSGKFPCGYDQTRFTSSIIRLPNYIFSL